MLKLFVVLVVCLVVGAMTPFAHADSNTGFYTPPQPMPAGAPGDLIRTEPSRLLLEPSGQLAAFAASGTRIMYRSMDTHGKPIAVTGTYFEPDEPWAGSGPRPLISYAVGTYGMGEQCAPSKLFNQGIHFSGGLDVMFGYEEVSLATMVARGFAVVVTDYEGLGTFPGAHTYLNRLAEGHAVLDAARAAQHLPHTSLDSQGPVGLWGYSQGGGAAASAAELASSYAPELHLVGTYAGAPPADLHALGPSVDGSAVAGLFGYVLNGLIYAYPEIEPTIRNALTDSGRLWLDTTKSECDLQTVGEYAFRPLEGFFSSPLDAALTDPAFLSLVDQQRLGRLTPDAPVLLDIGRNDTVIPYRTVVQLAQDWCSRYSDIQLLTNDQPPLFDGLGIQHGLTYIVDSGRSLEWITDRFNSQRTTPNC
jgi:pimeloyl-ACP methyl ester carboxylesterase